MNDFKDTRMFLYKIKFLINGLITILGMEVKIVHKVLLINSPIEGENGRDALPPLGLGYISYELERKEFKTSLLDAFLENKNKEQIIEEIKKEKPNSIIINIFSPNKNIVKEILFDIPQNIKVVVGGSVVKSIYKELLKCETKCELHIVQGEGEKIIPKILAGTIEKEEIKEKSLGNFFYQVDKVSNYFPKEISKSRLNREIFQNEPKKNKYGKQEAFIITSRGCCYACAFCGASKKRNEDIAVRRLKKEEIKKEIEKIVEIYPKIESIRILDDLFLKNQVEINNAIEIFQGFNLEWRAMSHFNSFNKLNDEIARKMKISGCKEIFIGIEAAHPDTLKLINKERKVNNKIDKNSEELIKRISLLLKAGINVKGYFIYGFPEENKESVATTYSLAETLKKLSKKNNYKGEFSPTAFIYRPYHGTDLYEKLNNTIKDKDKDKDKDKINSNSNFNKNICNYSNLSSRMLEEFLEKTNNLK